MPQWAELPLLPQSSEAHITAALSEEGVHLIGLEDQAPQQHRSLWVQSLRETAAVHEKSLLLNDTKSLLEAIGDLALRMNLRAVSLEASYS